MMGIYIKDMNMPKSCADCPICYGQMECPISDLRFWRGRPENKEFKFTEERHPDCPLVPYPMPSVGRWIEKNNPNYSPFDNSEPYIAICSECFYTSDKKFNYCPNCGSRMEDGREQTF